MLGGQFRRPGVVWRRVSAGEEQGAKREQDARRAPARLASLPRALALALLGLWLVLTLVALAGLLGGAGPWSGASESLVPSEHRSAEQRTLILVRVDAQALAALGAGSEQSEREGLITADTDPRMVLEQASFALEEALGAAREPLAPPKTEITRWLDAHALYLLPVETHAALGERLSDANMRAEVAGLRARLSSPLFAVSGDQPRRDPLGLRELTAGASGRLGHVAQIPGSLAPQVSASGDLISASGDRALVAVRDEREAAALEAELGAALEHLPVEFSLIDAQVQRARMAEALRAQSTRLALACFAALTLLLSLILRRVGPVLILTGVLASAWAVLVWLAAGLELGVLGGVELGLGGVELLSLALIFIALGIGSEGALRLPKIGARGRVAPLVWALALAPLWLSPYPLWRSWALWWALAQLLLVLAMRVVAPSLLALARMDIAPAQRGFRPSAAPLLAGFVCLALAFAGAWAHPQRDYRSLARQPVLDETSAALERELVEHFFDPSMMVEARSRPAELGPEEDGYESPEAAALDAAASTSARLAELVPEAARRVDTPGSFVIPRAELESRKRALLGLELGSRMEVLSGQLEDQGLRAEAFAEFIRGAADIEELPSAQAALDGPLGPWIHAYFVEEGQAGQAGRALRTWVELRGRDGLMSQALSAAELEQLPRLRGPAIAALEDRAAGNSRLMMCALAGLWLSALVIWLGSGRLSTALAAALVGLCCELGLCLALQLLEQPRGPHELPVLLLVGASAALAGARASELAKTGQLLFARDFLLAAGCQVAVGLALLGMPQPLWRELGMGFAIGAALACGLGLFVAPGVARVFQRLDRGARTASEGRADGGARDG